MSKSGTPITAYSNEALEHRPAMFQHGTMPNIRPKAHRLALAVGCLFSNSLSHGQPKPLQVSRNDNGYAGAFFHVLFVPLPSGIVVARGLDFAHDTRHIRRLGPGRDAPGQLGFWV